MGPAGPRYDEIAETYHRLVADVRDDPAGAALFELLPELGGRRALDVACGEGRVSRELARRGARVVGVDLSPGQLARARAAEAADPLGIEYLEADIAAEDVLAGERFPVVTSHFGLSDVDDLPGAVASVARLIAPGGAFVFSILHPCFPGWGEDAPSSWPPGESYFSERFWLASNSGFRGKVGSNHRMLSTYLNVLVEHGLRVDRVAEPPPAGEWVRRKQPSEDLVPVFLVVRCRA